MRDTLEGRARARGEELTRESVARRADAVSKALCRAKNSGWRTARILAETIRTGPEAGVIPACEAFRQKLLGQEQQAVLSAQVEALDKLDKSWRVYTQDPKRDRWIPSNRDFYSP